MWRGRWVVLWGVVLGGCGLVLDLDPPDPQGEPRDAGGRDGSEPADAGGDASMDAGGMDARVGDAGGVDATRPDAGHDDSGRADTGTADAAPDAGCGGACAEGQQCCDGACVDLLSNSGHCGFCGNACPSSGLCIEGRCAECDPAVASSCPDAAEECSASGACESVCTEACSGGDTIVCCPEEMVCIDVSSDPNNCGACGVECGPKKHCSGGECRCGDTVDVLCMPGNTCVIDALGVGVCL